MLPSNCPKNSAVVIVQSANCHSVPLSSVVAQCRNVLLLKRLSPEVFSPVIEKVQAGERLSCELDGKRRSVASYGTLTSASGTLKLFTRCMSGPCAYMSGEF